MLLKIVGGGAGPLFDTLDKPGMFQSLIYIVSITRFFRQEVLYEVESRVADLFPAGEIEKQWIFESHADRLNWRLVVEGKRTAEQCVGDASQTPDVTTETILLLL